VHACLEHRQNQWLVQPARLKSSLQSMARKEALIIIPENREKIDAGETVDIQLLASSAVSHLAAAPMT
jgi:molybdopterin biosynthesis enzyme